MATEIAMHEAIARVRSWRIGGKYQLVNHLAASTFANVSIGRHLSTNERVAIKLEDHKRVPESHIEIEIPVYNLLSGEIGFPRVHWHGKFDRYRVLVMDLLGLSLQSLLTKCGGRFSLKTTLMIADQVFTRLETLHTTGYIHRDVKPENLCMGKDIDDCKTVYLLDFGLAEHRKDDKRHGNFERIFRDMTGTCRYASVNAHYIFEAQKSDDLESLGYMLIYFLRGSLPWKGIKPPYPSPNSNTGISSNSYSSFNNSTVKHSLVLDMKESMSTGELCEHLPEAFADYMDYVRRLEHRTPDYTYLRNLFRKLAGQRGYVYNGISDWFFVEWTRRYGCLDDVPVKDDREYVGLTEDLDID